MKRLSVSERVAVENRTYKPGEYGEADMPVQHFDELLRTGFGKLIEDGKAEAITITINPLEPQDLFPAEVLNEDLVPPASLPVASEAEAPLLERTVKEIKESLSGLPDEGLFIMLEEERAGKNRKGVVEAIEAELDAREKANKPENEGDDE